MTALIKMDKPVHEHDCDSCIYLGTYSNYRLNAPSAKHIDCYWCSQKDHPSLSSVLGRYGSDGPDYSASHPPEAFSAQQDYLYYAEAWYLFAILQATRMGLYKPNTNVKCKTYAEAK